ncbi:hypothetical protein Vretifemale_426 [Volvox reticuliferus]|uniref:Uncharacterized protein n=1 Tax=Volvox reticuliferus TaxID=1737510 RepID=A0A8J4BVW2_9CHLO|nr:hypothetical protein Vretifemale_426 [Volvox reticuliferus]
MLEPTPLDAGTRGPLSQHRVPIGGPANSEALPAQRLPWSPLPPAALNPSPEASDLGLGGSGGDQAEFRCASMGGTPRTAIAALTPPRRCSPSSSAGPAPLSFSRSSDSGAITR